jgi:hypothetical protein
MMMMMMMMMMMIILGVPEYPDQLNNYHGLREHAIKSLVLFMFIREIIFMRWWLW